MPPRWNNRGDGFKPQWNIVQDSGGAILGTYYAEQQPLREHIEIIKKFLIHFKQQENEKMGTTTGDKINMVFLAGTLKFDPNDYPNAVKALIDTGQKSAIQVGVTKEGNAELCTKLLRFRAGDQIKLVAMLEPYGVKQADGTWKNGLGIRLTEIRTEPPRRDPVRGKQEQKAMDDMIPF